MVAHNKTLQPRSHAMVSAMRQFASAACELNVKPLCRYVTDDYLRISMTHGQPRVTPHPTVDLLAWARNLPVAVPVRSDSTPKKFRLRPETIQLPAAMATTDMRAVSSSRSPGSGAIWIEHMAFTADRPGFRALGLVLLAYALSNQEEPFRLTLSDNPDEIAQLVIWPSRASDLEARLGFRHCINEISYRPRLPDQNPNYLTFEQQREGFPREHLPYCRPGSWDVEGGGVTRAGEPVCAHFHGTSPSLVWLGKYLLDLALEDCEAALAYLYNSTPGESMAPDSAELRFVVANPADGPRLLPG
jgi:hypothetical protein